jgi:pimeloyl-ACP methyl ester carboxylesterase
VKVGGSGAPLVYLHTAGGPRWDAFLDLLATQHTVYAPDHPGTGETARDSIYAVESVWDLVLIYDEILDALGLESTALVGSSFGGWRDDAPVTAYMLLTPEEVPGTLFHNLEAQPVQDVLRMPTDPEELALELADSVWALGATGKFVWPIPDKGLDRRLHRISAATLILWGREDRVISAAYAHEFADRIAGSRVEIIEAAGHMPQWEQLETVAPLVLEFLDEGG